MLGRVVGEIRERGGRAVRALVADLTVKAGARRFFIRAQPQRADAECKRTQKSPSDETQLQTEQPPLVALHEILGGFDRVHRAKTGMFIENIGRHGVAVARDDARDDQKQRPQGNEDCSQQRQQKTVSETVKLRKQVGNLRVLVVNEREVEFRVAKLDRAANDKADERVDR